VAPAGRHGRQVSPARAISTALKTGWHRSVRLLLAVQICCGAGMTTVELLWQPLTGQRGGKDWIFGLMGAGAWAIGGAGAALLPRVVRMLRGKVTRAAALSRFCQGLALVPLALTVTGLPGVVAG